MLRVLYFTIFAKRSHTLCKSVYFPLKIIKGRMYIWIEVKSESLIVIFWRLYYFDALGEVAIKVA
jgi:hypothetical protein